MSTFLNGVLLRAGCTCLMLGDTVFPLYHMSIMQVSFPARFESHPVTRILANQAMRSMAPSPKIVVLIFSMLFSGSFFLSFFLF